MAVYRHGGLCPTKGKARGGLVAGPTSCVSRQRNPCVKGTPSSNQTRKRFNVGKGFGLRRVTRQQHLRAHGRFDMGIFMDDAGSARFKV
jgi:hypothetical protein